MIDPGAFPGPATPNSVGFGINEFNDIVGRSEHWPSGEQHAFVWLYCERFGLPARTLVDLTDASGNTPFYGEARELNGAGVVVGAQQFAASSGYRPVPWDLSLWNGGSIPPLTAEQAPGYSDPNSPTGGCTGLLDYMGGVAFAVAESTPAEIVGRIDEDFCLGSQDPLIGGESFGFHWVRGDCRLILLDRNDPTDRVSGAFDINDATPARLIGGFSTISCGTKAFCAADRDAVSWGSASAGSPTPVLPGPLADVGPLHGSEVLGVSDAGEHVGAFWVGPPPTDCLERAAYWSSTGAVPESFATALQLAGFDGVDACATWLRSGASADEARALCDTLLALTTAIESGAL